MGLALALDGGVGAYVPVPEERLRKSSAAVILAAAIRMSFEGVRCGFLFLVRLCPAAVENFFGSLKCLILQAVTSGTCHVRLYLGDSFWLPLPLSAAQLWERGIHSTIGALIITRTILGVPYCNHSIMGPKTLF